MGIKYCPWGKKNDMIKLAQDEGLENYSQLNKSELCRCLNKHFIGKEKIYAPEKYLKGLTLDEKINRLKQIQESHKKNNKNSYKPPKSDFDNNGNRKKTKKSKYTKAFEEMYPNVDGLDETAEATGIPLDILEKVYKKGLAAWRGGHHRPGATQQQWGYARVYSFIMKGCTYYNPDHKLVEEAMKRSKKAKKHWDSVEKMCNK